VDEDEPWPADVLARGEIPLLKALTMHNGTVYRWNRPVYGVMDGKPTLRIENRPLPAGPTVLDGLANLSFLFGLALGLVEEIGDVGEKLPFHDCQANFYNAASTGLRSALHWLDGQTRPADELVLTLLPLAARGLDLAGVDEDASSRFLDIIAARVASGQTGAQWMLEGFNRMHAVVPRDEALQGLTRAYVDRQRTSQPVHTWKPAATPERSVRHAAYETVSQVMRSDLKTVQEEDAVSLAEAVMRWEGIRHVLVENEAGEFVGLVSVAEILEAAKAETGPGQMRIGEVMNAEVKTVVPEMRTLDAIRMMQEEKLSCLPVLRDGKLVGLVTAADFLVVAARLLE
jgi:CBS domain-containing protein